MTVTRRQALGALALPLLAACAPTLTREPTPRPAVGYPRTIKHLNGETPLAAPPQRIAALWQPTLAALVQLGERPVATVGEATQPDGGLPPFLPPEYPIASLALVGPQRQPDLEKLAGARPDLVLAVPASGPDGLYTRLMPVAPSVVLEWSGTGAWRTHVVSVADVLGVSAWAEAALADYRARVEAVKRRIRLDPAHVQLSLVRVQSARELRWETPLGFPGQVMADLGFGRPDVQVTPDADRDFVSVGLERIREADGDLVCVLVNDQNQAAWTDLQANSLWQGLRAAQASRIFTFNYAWWGASNYHAAYRILADVERVLS